eukprot:CAMPEP_0113959836 /NCGR_PEP_ID=MMETSP0011_2-20120614/4373_1 /TAXON_ID=101924 /ORGANISM="Rhodosorus marinus" /LENGTH=456 /DNA_ID=CAMNT_0000971207 /DNA_START=411 /DNA_END=1781 /DNA_ORIENTATION=+ /assembly_acc=CAM_ASM_000156
MALVGTEGLGPSVCTLSSVLEWNSIPLNWMMFKSDKQAVPHPGDWSIMLMDTIFKVPVATGMALQKSEVARMISVLNQPSLMMTEVHERNYSLGSGWAFVGGLPQLGVKANSTFQGLQRIRFVTFFENRKAVVILSSEVRPGVIAFIRLAELNGRYNYSIWGLAEKDSGTITASQEHLDRRNCDMCNLMDIACDPRGCNNEQSFEDLRASREQILDQMEYPMYTMEYTKAWLPGKWTVPVGPLEPVTFRTSGYISGASFDLALLSVRQDESTRVHPPRSTFRFVKLGMNEMDYFLNLEGAATTETARSNGTAQISYEKQTDETLDHVQEDSKGLPRPKGGTKVCELCGMSFRRVHDLKRHGVAIHGKRKDYTCRYCQQTFTQNGHLNEHIRVTHSGRNVFKCEICLSVFGAKSKLQRHVVTVHENRRNFECGICHGKYKEKSYLKQHLQAVHGKEM